MSTRSEATIPVILALIGSYMHEGLTILLSLIGPPSRFSYYWDMALLVVLCLLFIILLAYRRIRLHHVTTT
jgi:L-asparagine transporter-like permease